MAGKLLARLDVPARFVGVQRALAVGIGDEDFADGTLVGSLDMEGAGASLALDEAKNLHLVRAATALFDALARADVGFIRLDRLALAPDRGRGAISHCLANSVRDEPSRLVRDAKGAMQLVGADALFARRHEAEGEQPLVERDMRALE